MPRYFFFIVCAPLCVAILFVRLFPLSLSVILTSFIELQAQDLVLACEISDGFGGKACPWKKFPEHYRLGLTNSALSSLSDSVPQGTLIPLLDATLC